MEKLRVEVVYALPHTQHVRVVILAAGATVADALAAAEVHVRHPEIDPARQPVGIFGRRVRLEHRLCNGDRVEIYRALVADPRVARRRRAGKGKR
jgi:putative ubiquitin-RnfH superfamily antitoxin RatB of RatAB toxin-antitoxin module